MYHKIYAMDKKSTPLVSTTVPVKDMKKDLNWIKTLFIEVGAVSRKGVQLQ